ncbi:hypothetical protein [Brevundimonas sp. Root1279]|uniref:hypothetical protein n=1 Tax=Brevundimonas sp. Root1279 TaxID=1736443 RepID=UPI0007009EDD|nr:hypothetical protein [Brevundimonas sp. Root1279]KQW79804.1 hypothetical protein ASC65_14760 [Brevundimonas sp. Root1279]
MTGGLIVWAVHFIGVYLISSVADVVATADDAGWRMAGLAFSGLCALTAAASLWAALRRLRDRKDAFAGQIAAFGSGVAVIAIVWQALPTVIGH